MRKWNVMLDFKKDMRIEVQRMIRMNQPELMCEVKGRHMEAQPHYLVGVQDSAEHATVAVYDTYTVISDGTLYNADCLLERLKKAGYRFLTEDTEEILLYSYLYWQEDCLKEFNGVFAFAILSNEEAFFARDAVGVKPLYYTRCNDGGWLFSSAIKGILAEGSRAPILDELSFQEMMTIGPSLTPGRSFLKGIRQLEPGHYLRINRTHTKQKAYHDYISRPHTDSLAQTIQTVKELLTDAVALQSQQKTGSFLSGGLDSSIVTAIASRLGHSVRTYSLDYEGNADHFSGYSYQTSRDNEYIEQFLDAYPLPNQLLVLPQQELADHLLPAMIARDGVGMADVDASLLWLSKQVATQTAVVLTGECADEVFLGYPWFYRPELLETDFFPWITQSANRLSLLNNRYDKEQYMDYGKALYQEALNQVNHHPWENKQEHRLKEIQYLCFRYFMQTLLSRMECMGSAAGIEGRVPFADIRLMDYAYNIPPEWLFLHDEEKGLLKEAFKDILPEAILHRRKNPFPKTHHPLYGELVAKLLQRELKEHQALSYLFDYDTLLTLIESRGASFTTPWFGQLMKGPQLLAFLYQFSCWLKQYQVKIEF